jgi:hypothetical protein
MFFFFSPFVFKNLFHKNQKNNVSLYHYNIILFFDYIKN